ncbi:hypothetical protein BU23DRAFT_628217 [Bimuria novae-zelandiae CBS 107.79]|uniref:Uncharacterized protein n=1 Tax=Bimuria novae-zelandiae CBS 107.79 TaxID=1447943 RepID=A0A6A5VHV9_9PLEO|nr:hypothetical protein BU23DRAFT_628217 [Bimuria novae-zelandiae CBS 107.79]
MPKQMQSGPSSTNGLRQNEESSDEEMADDDSDADSSDTEEGDAEDEEMLDEPPGTKRPPSYFCAVCNKYYSDLRKHEETFTHLDNLGMRIANVLSDLSAPKTPTSEPVLMHYCEVCDLTVLAKSIRRHEGSSGHLEQMAERLAGEFFGPREVDVADSTCSSSRRRPRVEGGNSRGGQFRCAHEHEPGARKLDTSQSHAHNHRTGEEAVRKRKPKSAEIWTVEKDEQLLRAWMQMRSEAQIAEKMGISQKRVIRKRTLLTNPQPTKGGTMAYSATYMKLMREFNPGKYSKIVGECRS